jgi:hypothetical protein
MPYQQYYKPDVIVSETYLGVDVTDIIYPRAWENPHQSLLMSYNFNRDDLMEIPYWDNIFECGECPE